MRRIGLYSGSEYSERRTHRVHAAAAAHLNPSSFFASYYVRIVALCSSWGLSIKGIGPPGIAYFEMVDTRRWTTTSWSKHIPHSSTWYGVGWRFPQRPWSGGIQILVNSYHGSGTSPSMRCENDPPATVVTGERWATRRMHPPCRDQRCEAPTILTRHEEDVGHRVPA
jgi:hypothetical protein